MLDRFREETPNIYGLKETLQRIELSIVKQAPTPASSAQQSAAPAQSATTPTTTGLPKPAVAAGHDSAPLPKLADPAEVNKSSSRSASRCTRLPRALFKASKGDPLAYRLCRQGLYMQLQGAPPASSGNQTTVPPPPQDRDTQLKALVGSQNWDVLLDEAESGLAGTRFWIDTHRYVALALGGLGHEQARDTVLAETAALVQRFPELLERTFSDGQPFASPATREWLSTVAPVGGGTTRSVVTDGGRVRCVRGPASGSAQAGSRREARRGRGEPEHPDTFRRGRRPQSASVRSSQWPDACFGGRGSCPGGGDSCWFDGGNSAVSGWKNGNLRSPKHVIVRATRPWQPWQVRAQNRETSSWMCTANCVR